MVGKIREPSGCVWLGQVTRLVGMSEVSHTGFGVDVGATRLDDLDKRLLVEVESQTGVRVLDLGCGVGGAAAHLRQGGAEIVGVDQHDFAAAWQDVGVFYQADIASLPTLLPSEQFTHCLCQRTIHYVPYNDALKLLLHLRTVVTHTLFISFSGATSALAHEYPTLDHPVTNRHALLAPAEQTTFGITAPITLYHAVEAIDLIEQAGWKIIWSRTTDFGNILVVATRSV